MKYIWLWEIVKDYIIKHPKRAKVIGIVLLLFLVIMFILSSLNLI